MAGPAVASQVPGSAVSKKRKEPVHTKQMNPTWNGLYTADTAFQAETSRHAGAKSTAALAVKREVTVYLFMKDNVEAEIHALQGSDEQDSDIPLWPSLSTTQLLKALGYPEILSIAYYNISEWVWKFIKLSHVFSVTNHETVLIKVQGVTNCHQIDDVITHALPQGTKTSFHLFGDLQVNRKVVKQQLTSHPLLLPGLEKPIKIEPGTDDTNSHQKKRQQVGLGSKQAPIILEHSLSPHGPSSTVNKSTITRTSSYQPSLSAPSSSGASSTDSLPSVSELIEHAQKKPVWPNGQYTINVVLGMEKMQTYTGLSQSERFEKVFGCKYVQQTFSDARQRWCMAPECLCNKLISAGSTPDGLWDVLRQKIKLKRAVKQKHSNSTSDSVISISDDDDDPCPALSASKKRKGRVVKVESDGIDELSLSE
ncbi:hypothetical protein FIBSPDRAFT_948328 [Athelia psychrophila]|uniref:Uncharacterized protein n=1 Tax=Athelia psychrophila TaxID=1759441 RepID=A0A166R023_9AGAM|nr:hypothetical protein FIBSPDRAFT_948328 [Fibularhizoctonia sp. CBS 109695]